MYSYVVYILASTLLDLRGIYWLNTSLLYEYIYERNILVICYIYSYSNDIVVLW